MKELLKSIVTIGVVVLIAFFLYKNLPSESFQQFKTKSIDLSGERVGNYKLSDSLNSGDIRSNQFGRAASDGNMQYTYDSEKEDFNHIKLSDGIVAVSEEEAGIDTILGYMVYHKDFETEKGIKIGDSREDVVQAYGQNYYTMKMSEKDFIGYVDKDNGLTIRFHLKDDLVRRFDLNYREVNKELNL